MDIPIKFPSEPKVILDDVARFRALSALERVRTIRALLADGAFLMSISPKAAWAKLTANRDQIDVDLIRQEWSPYAATEAERTVWLEATIARRVVRRE